MANAIEYGLMAALISVVVITVVQRFQPQGQKDLAVMEPKASVVAASTPTRGSMEVRCLKIEGLPSGADRRVAYFSLDRSTPFGVIDQLWRRNDNASPTAYSDGDACPEGTWPAIVLTK